MTPRALFIELKASCRMQTAGLMPAVCCCLKSVPKEKTDLSNAGLHITLCKAITLFLDSIPQLLHQSIWRLCGHACPCSLSCKRAPTGQKS